MFQWIRKCYIDFQSICFSCNLTGIFQGFCGIRWCLILGTGMATSYDSVPLMQSNRRTQQSFGKSFPYPADNLAYLSTSLTSSFGQSTSESLVLPQQFISPEHNNSKRMDHLMKTDNCDLQLTTYFSKWICLQAFTPPCFMIVMQGTKYKAAKKICPSMPLPWALNLDTEKC